MSEKSNTTPRLLAAASEFNIGKDTLVEFLTKKGFEIDGSKVNTKLTEEMYFTLEENYAKDKAAKRKSEALSLPKSQNVSFVNTTDAEKVEEVEKAEPRLEKKIIKPEELIPIDGAIASEEPKKKTTKASKKKEEPAISKEPESTATATDATEAKDQEKQIEEKTAKDEAVKENGTKTKIEGFKVVNKIDLDAINSKTRPTKKTVSKTEKPTESKPEKKTTTKAAKKTTESPVSKTPKVDEILPASQPVAKEEKPIVPTPPPVEEKPEHIETQFRNLDGPKIIGKIELPVREDTRPAKKEKKKRKRIPVENKPKVTPGAANKPGQDTRPGDKKPGTFNKRDGNRPGVRRDNKSNVPTEIDAKEIQEKIRQTQAKLAGIGPKSQRQLKSKYRKDKREEHEMKRAEELQAGEGIIEVTEFITVTELANLLDVSFTDIISKCMDLGMMVSINQRLDAEVIELVAAEFNKEVKFIDLKDSADESEDEEIDDPESLEERAPVVTIMGHVDHGKTSLLDYIRNSSVVAGEAGGITQHIGAYKVKTESGKNIAFLDTPGHEAFTSMRARGAKVADVAVIVIAADDAIMPTTREAISHAQAANLPMVFAINKIDREGSNPERIKEQLSAMNILVEDWGGNYQCQEISAKMGLNIDQLLEKILLEAELLELKANPNKNASGSIIEASLDKGRGFVTTVLVQSGTLRHGDMLLAGQYYGKVKAMFNERGARVKEATPSTPVQILGLNGAPNAGETFRIYQDESEAKSVATHRAQILREQGLRSKKVITLDEIGRRLALGNFKELNIIIKADFDGSAEALSDSLQKLSTEEVVVNVILKGVGQISESDIMLAAASNAIIIGFQVRASPQSAKVADQENVEIRYYSIIYDAINEVKSAMEGLLEPKIEQKIVGNIEVREVYKISNVGTIAGCYVQDGKFTRNTKLNVIRDGIVVHTGELASLKRFKDDVKEVSAGYECGIMIKNFADIRVGDIVEGFEDVEVKRKL